MNILPMHNALKPLAWLEGIWHIENVGFGKFPTIMPFRYCEELIFASVGQPMFNYSAQSWHSEKLNPMHRESGFLRVIPDTNKVMLVLAHNFGLTTIEEGEMEHQAVKLVSTNISRPTTGTKPPAVLEIRRQFELIGDRLHHTLFMATEATPELTEHLHAVYKKLQWDPSLDEDEDETEET